MAAFFPGAGPPQLLTPTQRAGYLRHMGEVLYLRDRALLGYHFSKFDDESAAKLLAPSAGNPARAAAYREFIRAYGLGEQIDPQAAREFMAASKAGRVPAWVMACADLSEIKRVAKGG